MQYCYMPAGDWETDATPAAYKPKDAVSFHILAGVADGADVDQARNLVALCIELRQQRTGSSGSTFKFRLIRFVGEQDIANGDLIAQEE